MLKSSSILFVVVLAAGIAALPAKAQEQCYDLVQSSCTYENIQRCMSCMDAFCDRQRLDCLAFEDDGTCDANYDMCRGDGIIRCQNCGNEDHGSGTGCVTCGPGWPSQAGPRTPRTRGAGGLLAAYLVCTPSGGTPDGEWDCKIVKEP